MITIKNFGRAAGQVISDAEVRYYALTPSGRQIGTIWKSNDAASWIGTFSEAGLGEAVSPRLKRKVDVANWINDVYQTRIEEASVNPDLRRLVQMTTRNGAKASALLPVFEHCRRAGADISVEQRASDGSQVYWSIPIDYVEGGLRSHAQNRELDSIGLRGKTYLIEDEDLLDRLVADFPKDIIKGEPLYLPPSPDQQHLSTQTVKAAGNSLSM